MVNDNQPEDVANPGMSDDRPKVVAYTKKSNMDPAKDNFKSAQESYKAELSGKEPEKKYSGVKGKNIKISNVGSGGSISGALKAMLGFFTIVRVNVDDRDIQSMERNFWLAPIIGAIIGLFSMVTCLVFYKLGVPSFALAAIALAVAFMISKFLHFDGLTDFGDGMVATGDREKRIGALKDTAIGAGGFGVAFIVILLSFSILGSFGVIMCAIVWPMEILVKNAMVVTAAFGEPGNGMAAGQVRNTTLNTMIVSTITACIAGAIALLIGMSAVQSIMDIEMLGSDILWKYIIGFFVALAFSIVIGFVMAKMANKTFGYVNGDVLGATNEVSRAVILLFFFITLALSKVGVA